MTAIGRRQQTNSSQQVKITEIKLKGRDVNSKINKSIENLSPTIFCVKLIPYRPRVNLEISALHLEQKKT